MMPAVGLYVGGMRTLCPDSPPRSLAGVTTAGKILDTNNQETGPSTKV